MTLNSIRRWMLNPVTLVLAYFQGLPLTERGRRAAMKEMDAKARLRYGIVYQDDAVAWNALQEISNPLRAVEEIRRLGLMGTEDAARAFSMIQRHNWDKT